MIVQGNEVKFYHRRIGELYQSAQCCFPDFCGCCQPLFWSGEESKAVLQEPAHLATASRSGLVVLQIGEMQELVKDLVKDQQNTWII